MAAPGSIWGRTDPKAAAAAAAVATMTMSTSSELVRRRLAWRMRTGSDNEVSGLLGVQPVGVTPAVLSTVTPVVAESSPADPASVLLPPAALLQSPPGADDAAFTCVNADGKPEPVAAYASGAIAAHSAAQSSPSAGLPVIHMSVPSPVRIASLASLEESCASMSRSSSCGLIDESALEARARLEFPELRDSATGSTDPFDQPVVVDATSSEPVQSHNEPFDAARETKLRVAAVFVH